MSLGIWAIVIIVAAVAFVLGILTGMAISDNWWRKRAGRIHYPLSTRDNIGGKK